MLETCGRCRGEGVCSNDRDGWGWCPECGGGGYIDPYFEDEWYEDDDDWSEWYDFDGDDDESEISL